MNITANTPWDQDSPDADLLDRAAQGGVPTDAILDALGSRRDQHGDRVLARDTLSRTDIHKLETLARRYGADLYAAAPTEAAAENVRLATPRQVDYILALCERRQRSGEGGGFYNGPTDRAGIEKLSTNQASTYINSLKGDY